MSSHSRAATRHREQHRINDRIRAREVRLIGPDGDQLGIKPVPEALRMARGLDLDLVEVAPMANPPVCRIMDYGKFRYEEAQKAKESRRKSTNVSVKEVKFRPKIGRGDFDIKVRKVDQFIHEGHKVKVTLQFRGREMAHPELGTKILDEVLDVVGPSSRSRPRPASKVATCRWCCRPTRRRSTRQGRPRTPPTEARRRRGRRRRAPAPARRRPTPPTPASRSSRPTGRRAERPPEPSTPLRREHHTMPKMKTSKTAAKRFKTTGTGRLRREQAMRQHLFEKKPSTRTRRLAADADVHPTDVKKIKRLLGER